MTRHVHFSNEQTRALAMGLAVDPNTHLAYYVSAAGPKSTLKSLRGGLLAASSRSTPVTSAGHWTPRKFAAYTEEGTTEAWEQLPRTHNCHYVLASDSPALVVVTPTEEQWAELAATGDPIGALEAPDLRREMLAAQREDTLTRFAQQLNAVIDDPVLPEWSDALWSAARTAEDALIGLTTAGDCLAAVQINREYDWEALLDELIDTDAIEL